MDLRADAARFYDLNPDVPGDLAFYRSRVSSSDVDVLELGCGTGRVLVPLVNSCRYIHGVDSSEAMLSICREKLKRAGIPLSKAFVECACIADLNLGRRFNWIIAPYRVFQNLETDAEVTAYFASVRRHLAPGGTGILTVFNPDRDRVTLAREWCRETETVNWEVTTHEGRVTCHDRRTRMDPVKFVLYPDLVYRRYRGPDLVEEAVLELVMRCYYPEELEELVTVHGFQIVARWGGYSGEPYGRGPELILEFGKG